MISKHGHLTFSTFPTVALSVARCTIAGPAILLAGLAISLGACDGKDTPPAGSPHGGDAGADAEEAVDFSCLPDCYRQAFETCQPAGACHVELAPGSTMDNIEDWVCFDNGVRTHLVQTMSGGSRATTTEISTAAGLCRRLEVMEGPSGGFFAIKDGSGAILASATITSYPGITIACPNMEMEWHLDRTTPCGSAAAREISTPSGTPDLLARCTVGPCAP